MEKIINTKNVYQRLSEVRKKADYIKKVYSEDMKYHAVKNSQVLDLIKNAIDENGLFLSVELINDKCITTKDERKTKYGMQSMFLATYEMIYIWVNIDNPSEIIKTPWKCTAWNDDPAKAIGASLTYAEKYFLLKTFNIPTDNHDPDFNKIPEPTKADQEAEIKRLEDEKKALEKAKVWNEFYEKMKETLSNKTFKSVSEYVEFIEITYLKKSPQLKDNQGFKSIFEAFMPKAQVNENKAKQSVTKFDKCMDCKNETEFCICDIDKKTVLTKV